MSTYSLLPITYDFLTREGENSIVRFAGLSIYGKFDQFLCMKNRCCQYSVQYLPIPIKIIFKIKVPRRSSCKRWALIRYFLQSARIKCCNFWRVKTMYEPLSLDVATSQFEISDILKNHTLNFTLIVSC